MTAPLVRVAVPVYAAAVVFVLSLADGGFFPWTWPWAILALLSAAAGASLILGEAKPTRLELVFLMGLAALAAWQAVSARWAADPDRALEDALRGTVYVAAAAAFLVLTRAVGARSVVVGLVSGGVATLAYGVVRHVRSDAFDPFQGRLLYQPIGYANAVGILAAMMVLLLLGLLVEQRTRARQAGLAIGICLSVAALQMTHSRGAWLAGLIGLTTMAVHLNRGRRRALPVWLALAASFVVALLLSPLIVDPVRLHTALNDRAYYWAVAWHAIGSPFRGIGSGAFAQLWAIERPVAVNAIDAHSLFLESLLELGVVGLVFLVVTVSAPLVAVARLRGGWAAGATGAYVAFLMHAAVDWDWELPAVTVAGLGCGAALLGATRHGSIESPSAATSDPCSTPCRTTSRRASAASLR
jgi:O-antigen ligase